MEIAYYPGCSLQESAFLYNLQNQLVFRRLGIDLKEIDDWSCCGATSAAKVEDFLAVAMPARNLGIAEAAGFSEMVIPCSACYSKTLVAQRRLVDDAELKDEINSQLSKKVQGKIVVSSILEVLLRIAKSGELSKQISAIQAGLKPACYYGCMLTRFPYAVSVPDDVENPQDMEMILEMLGTTPLDWSYKTDCCGASAAVNDQGTALKLMARILRDALDRGANCLVTTCPMCQLNLDLHQNEICRRAEVHQRLPVYFITELIGVAIGISPGRLLIDRHFTDAMSLLKEVNPI